MAIEGDVAEGDGDPVVVEELAGLVLVELDAPAHEVQERSRTPWVHEVVCPR